MGRPRVVIVGAGFGGLACAQALARRPADVTVVDRNNYHLFTPLLYQVASALLKGGDIAKPIRSLVRGSGNVRVRHEAVTRVDRERRRVALEEGGELPYDYVVIATGSTTNYFGLAGAELASFGLKDLPEALELRNHVIRCLEEASAHPEDADPWLTFVVTGGGPTGVEYAGALAELLEFALPRDYTELGGRRAHIVLVEGLPEVLPSFAPDLSAVAHRELERKGVEVITGVRVSEATPEGVTLSDGRSLEAKTLVWAAGVKAVSLPGADDVATHAGRLRVDRFLRLEGDERVFVIGDAASFVQGGEELPMLSAPAMQEGRLAAKNILLAAAGKPLQPFRYRDKGSMATIGKNAAVAEIGWLHLRGFIGWVAWLVVHIYYLLGFRNRLAVLAGWAWNYVHADRPVRIIATARERDRSRRAEAQSLGSRK